MKKLAKKLAVYAAGVALALTAMAGGALAETIQNKLGVTGRLGFIVPTDSDLDDFKINSDAGFIFGGGLIYGIDKNVAVEFEVSHTWFGSETPSGRNTGDFDITDISFGGQYRFAQIDKVNPYAGAGLDILVNGYEHGDVDTVLGGHISLGADYFIMRNVAINGELKAVLAPDADIVIDGLKQGNFSPGSVSGTVGLRYFF